MPAWKKDSDFWNSILWSDETKIELFRRNQSQRMWRKRGDATNSRNTINMEVAIFPVFFLAKTKTRRFYKIVGTMKECDILKETLEDFVKYKFFFVCFYFLFGFVLFRFLKTTFRFPA